MSFAAKKPDATCYSSFPASKIVIPLTSQPLEHLRGHDVALHAHSIGNKGIQTTAPITSLLKSLQCSLQKVTTLRLLSEASFSMPWTSPCFLPHPAAPYPAPSCQWWILALCYPIPLGERPSPFLNSSWAARHILLSWGLATEDHLRVLSKVVKAPAHRACQVRYCFLCLPRLSFLSKPMLLVSIRTHTVLSPLCLLPMLLSCWEFYFSFLSES